MAKVEKPWIELEKESVPAREVKERSRWNKGLAWVMCAFLICGGIVTPYKIAILFGVLYILVLLMDKQTAATPRGIEIFYDMKITTSYTFWPWKEISAISREENAKYPGIYAVYFTRGDKSKRLFFNKDQWEALIRLAKQGNHGLQIVKE